MAHPNLLRVIRSCAKWRNGFLLVASLVMALPFIWMVLSSLKGQAEIFVFPPRWLPETPRWNNYIDVTKAMPFGWFTYNSLKIASLSVVGQLLSASLAA